MSEDLERNTEDVASPLVMADGDLHHDTDIMDRAALLRRTALAASALSIAPLLGSGSDARAAGMAVTSEQEDVP